MASTTVTFYRNGDPTFPGKKLVVNRRQIRTMDALLDNVTKHTSMTKAARTIKTPTGRHTIRQLDSIESGGCYVAVGSEGFKRLPYTEIKVHQRNSQRKEIEITPVKHSKLQMSARARKVADAEPNNHKIIFAFRNGDDLYPSTKMLLSQRDLTTMDNVLKVVTNKVHLQSGAVFWLFSMDGKEVKEALDLQNNGQYVAVGHGKKFKKVAYSDQGNSLTPRGKAQTRTQVKVTQVSKKTKSPSYRTKNAPFKPNKTQQRKTSTESGGSKRSSINSPHIEDPFKRKSLEEEMRKTISENVPEKYIHPKQADFPSPIDQIYKASGENQEQGQEVQDDKEVIEDKPIDQMPAEEVEDEEIEEQKDAGESNKDNTKASFFDKVEDAVEDHLTQD